MGIIQDVVRFFSVPFTVDKNVKGGEDFNRTVSSTSQAQLKGGLIHVVPSTITTC